MNTFRLVRALDRYPVFDLATFASIAELEDETARVRLFRMKKQEYVIQLQRNRYTVHNDPLIVASRIVWPSYISLWYALSYHGLTYQIPHEISVVTPRKKFRTEITFKGMKISFTRIAPKYFFGFDRLLINNQEVFMALAEKAIIDGIVLKRISVSEIFDILKDNIDKLDIGLIIELIQRCESCGLAKRMGYMLEMLGWEVYKKLKNLIYPTSLPLDFSLPKKGEIDRKWGIIDNVDVI